MFFFALFSIILYAPNHNTITLLYPEPVKKSYTFYNPLIDAIFFVEASKNVLAYNSKENAVGGLQIRQCRLDHYNQLTNKNYTLKDMYDFEKAKEVFLYFTDHDSNGREIPNKSWEKAAKDWNGSGPKTENYWNKVKANISV